MSRYSKFWFGKYKGKHLWRVAVENLAYIESCEQIGLIKISEDARKFIDKIRRNYA